MFNNLESSNKIKRILIIDGTNNLIRAVSISQSYNLNSYEIFFKTLGNYITQLRSSEYCTIRDRKEIALLKRVKSTQECFKKNQKLLDEGMHKKTITQILY